MEFTHPPIYYYKRALEYYTISTDGADPITGLCHALAVAVSDEPILENTVYPGVKYFYIIAEELTENGFFKDLYKYKPIGSKSYWYPTTPEGRIIRMALLQIVIDQLEDW